MQTSNVLKLKKKKIPHGISRRSPQEWLINDNSSTRQIKSFLTNFGEKQKTKSKIKNKTCTD